MRRWDRAVALVETSASPNSLAPPFALAADAQSAAARLIGELCLSRVLECGPGQSTVALATLVSGDYQALEHDPVFVERVRHLLADAGLAHRVTVHYSPIVFRRADAFVGRTYDPRVLRGSFDFMLIDGPPARTIGRLLTLPALWPFLDAGALILLDDARRRHERWALRAWQARYGAAIRVRSFDGYAKGLALIEKRAAAPAGRCWPAVAASCFEAAQTWLWRLRVRVRAWSPM